MKKVYITKNKDLFSLLKETKVPIIQGLSIRGLVALGSLDKLGVTIVWENEDGTYGVSLSPAEMYHIETVPGWGVTFSMYEPDNEEQDPTHAEAWKEVCTVSDEDYRYISIN